MIGRLTVTVTPEPEFRFSWPPPRLIGWPAAPSWVSAVKEPETLPLMYRPPVKEFGYRPLNWKRFATRMSMPPITTPPDPLMRLAPVSRNWVPRLM